MTNRRENRRYNILLSTVMSMMIIFLVVSCTKGSRFVKCRSFVMCYTRCDVVVADISFNSDDCIMLYNRCNYPICTYNLYSQGGDKDRYDSLCVKHKDVGYNGYGTYNSKLKIYGKEYVDRDFSAIEIYSENYFDANHPAGGSVADIVRFMSASPHRYIESGYKDYFHYNESTLSDDYKRYMPDNLPSSFFDRSIDNTDFPIDKIANELTADDLVLLGTISSDIIGYLCFEKKPEVPGEYRLNVNVIADDGEVFRNTVTMKF